MNSTKIPSILIVDDNPADIYLAQHYIRASEICDNITVCHSGQEAFDFLMSCKKHSSDPDKAGPEFPTMVLLDINMPGLDGFGLLKKIADSGLNDNTTAPFTIVMLTTSDFSGDEYRAKQYPQVGAYITKPLRDTHAPMLLSLHERQCSMSQPK